MTWEPPINENDTTYIKDYLDYCENYNGRFLYLAIRLKCLDCDYIDTINSKPVLTLRVPVKYYNEQINSSLFFSNLPDPNHNAVEIVRANDGQNILMGRRRKLDSDKASLNNEFLITDHMLMSTNLNHPDYTTGFSSIYRDYPGYITIYAKIIFYGDIGGLRTFQSRHGDNYREYGNKMRLDSLTSFDIEVIYHNTQNVAIDWIRLETPHTHEVLWGQKNIEIQQCLDTAISNVAKQSHIDSNNQILRIVDVVEGSEMAWDGMKYLRKMCGDIFAGENETPYQYLHQHYVGMKTSWLGLFKVTPNVARPFLKYGARNYGGQENGFPEFGISSWANPIHWTAGHHLGAYGIPICNSYTNNLNYNYLKNLIYSSTFDTYSKYSYSDLLDDDIKYNEVVNGSSERHSFQSYYEHHIQRHYNDNYLNYNDSDEFDRGKYAGFIYSDKDWWGQIFNLQEFDTAYKNPDYIYPNTLIKSPDNALTSEELRLISNNFMIMGAKGLLYDGQTWGSLKTASKLVKLEDKDDPFDYIRNINNQSWTDAYKNEKIKWASDSSINQYGIVRNPELGTDYLDAWFYKYFLWGAYPNNSNNGGRKFFYNNTINPNYNNNTFPPTPSFDNTSYVNNPYKTNSKLMGLHLDPSNPYSSRIYLGMNSQRMEITKINRYYSTPSVDSVLMQSKLLAWHGKGFRIIDNFDKNKFTKNYLIELLDINSIRTYKLKGYNFDENTPISCDYSEQSSPIDSGFYDITLLRVGDESGFELDTINLAAPICTTKDLILCVQNRRTDPLAKDSWLRNSTKDSLSNESRTIRHFELTDDSLDVFSKERINFLSQAEYDDRLISKPNPYTGAEKENYEHFGNMYWGKFGARKIEFWLNHTLKEYRTKTLQSFSELGSQDPELNGLYWRNNLFHIPHSITSYSSDNEDKLKLTLYLQPGEARLLKCKLICFTPKKIPIKLTFKSIPKHPLDPSVTPISEIELETDILAPLINFPIMAEVMKPNIYYEILSNSPLFDVSRETVIRNDSTQQNGDTSVIYTFNTPIIRSGEKLKMFSIKHTETIPFPVKLSYYTTNTVDSSVYLKDTIIYIGGNDTLHKMKQESAPIEELALSNLQTIPNPSDNEFELIFNSAIKQDLKISIIDNAGSNKLNIINYSAAIGINKLKINTNSLPTGNYILLIKNNSTQYHHKINVIR